jgi:hypothetical protein
LTQTVSIELKAVDALFTRLKTDARQVSQEASWQSRRFCRWIKHT